MQYARMSPSDFTGRLERVNQCVTEWSDEDAQIRRLEILRWLIRPENLVDGRPLRVVLLGRRVHKIWGVYSPSGFGYVRYGEDLQVAWIMHPSGSSRVYSEQSNRDRAGRYVRWAAGLPTTEFSTR